MNAQAGKPGKAQRLVSKFLRPRTSKEESKEASEEEISLHVAFTLES
jgi:hypothetical protein